MKSKITTFSLFFLCFAIVISAQIRGNQYKSKILRMKVLHKLWKISTEQVPHKSGAKLDVIKAQWTDCKIVVTVFNGVHISRFSDLNADGLRISMPKKFTQKTFKWIKKPKKQSFGAWRNKKLMGAEAQGVPIDSYRTADGKIIKRPDSKGRTFVMGEFYIAGSSSTLMVNYRYPVAFAKLRTTKKHVYLLYRTLRTIQK